jgi:hypothetical protein
VEEFHAAFANKDRLITIIKREKLAQFPYAGGLEGVVFEWRTRHQIPKMVRSVTALSCSAAGC